MTLSACNLQLPTVDPSASIDFLPNDSSSSESMQETTTQSETTSKKTSTTSLSTSTSTEDTSFNETTSVKSPESSSSLEITTITNETKAPLITSSESNSSSKNQIDIIFEGLTTDEDEDKVGSISHPYRIGDLAKFDGTNTIFDPFKAEVSIQKVYRGAEALKMVRDSSPINPLPSDGFEYLIAQVLVKITDSKNQETVGVSPYFFSLARDDGRMYGDVSLFRAVTPILEPLRVGETSIAYITFQVAESDDNPFIVFLSRANNGIWFTTEVSEESEITIPFSVSENDSQSNNPPEETERPAVSYIPLETSSNQS